MPNNISKLLMNTTYRLPIFGSGSDILLNAFVKRGPTPATDNGELIKASGTGASPDIIGRLAELHDFSVTGDTLIDGTNFVTHPVHIAHPFRIFRLEYDLSSLISATQAVTTTTMTISSLEDNIDAAFWYVVSGSGLGQTNYSVASATGNTTLKAAFGTNLSTSSRLIKILPRFHQIISLNSDGTMIASQAAAGAIKGMVIDTHIKRNGSISQMDPTTHAALTSLNNARSVKFYADVAIRDTIPHSVD